MKQLVIVFSLTLAAWAAHAPGDQGAQGAIQKEAAMTAHGTFDVKLTPQPKDDGAGGPFSRLVFDKEFHGDLEGTSKGHMLAADTATEGSGAYVALELVTGVLNGKRGSFILQHKGTMKKGAPTMHVSVIPDSGTDQLAGIDGEMTITIAGSKHSYELAYTLGGS